MRQLLGGSMDPSSQTGTGLALAYLERAGDGMQSRSLHQMAHEAGVSYVTMRKAFARRFGASRRVVRAREKRAGVGNPAANAVWKRVRGRIEEDLLQGNLHRDGLPLIKELCTRYSVSRATAKRALTALCDGRVLCRDGRRYRAARSEQTGPPSITVGMMIYAWYTGPLVFMAEYDQEFVPSLEQECGRAGVGMEIIRYQHPNDHLTTFDTSGTTERPLDARTSVDGIILVVISPWALCDDLFARLHATGKPVVIIDEIGGWELPPYLARSKRVLLIAAKSHVSASDRLARSIIEAGHRTAAFFSPFHSDSWSRECLEGMARVFAGAGKGYALRPFVAEGSTLTDDYERRAHQRQSSSSLLDGYTAWKKKLPKPYAVQLDPHFSTMFSQQLAYAEVRCVCDDLFSAAYGDKSITCWIAADTDIVWFMYDFLRARSSSLSLVSLGTSPQVTKDRITSVDYNAAAAAAASVQFLLAPTRKLPGQKGIVLEIQGKLTDRGSLRVKERK